MLARRASAALTVVLNRTAFAKAMAAFSKPRQSRLVSSAIHCSSERGFGRKSQNDQAEVFGNNSNNNKNR